MRRLPALPEAAICDLGGANAGGGLRSATPARRGQACGVDRLRDDREAGRLRPARRRRPPRCSRARTAHGRLFDHRPQMVLLGPACPTASSRWPSPVAASPASSCRACCRTAANRFFIQRLKDKCGNRSNASSEIEYRDAWRSLVGEEGRGIREILSHAHLTRLDFAVGSAGLMRQALTLALHHAHTRTAFGAPMAEQPMHDAMCWPTWPWRARRRAVARCGSRARPTTWRPSEHERLLARIATPVAKYWNCKRAPAVVV